MGKRLRQQRAGRGSSTFIAPTWRRIAPIKYPSWLHELLENSEQPIKGIVKEIDSESGREAPLALISLGDGKEFYTIAAEGIFEKSECFIGKNVPIKAGNITQIGSLPEGTLIFNIERRYADGGKFVRAAGSYATVFSQTIDGTIVSLPSGKLIKLDKRCLATIGVIAGGGKIEKPLLKAGKKYHISKAKSFKWPTVRGKAMYAASHPHGGGAHPKGGRPVKKTSPPGKKVGYYGPRRTGRRKG
jgi:large subunit ribosomal protein L2